MGLPWEINMNAHNHHLFVKPVLVLKTLQMTSGDQFSFFVDLYTVVHEAM